MKLEEVEDLVHQLEPRDQLRLAAGICQQLSADPDTDDQSKQARRERMLAALAFCDEVAESIAGEFDSAEDLRRIRSERMADIDRAVRGC